MRPAKYAETRGLSVYTVRWWLSRRILPFIKINQVILIDPKKADEALEAFERKAAQ